ncbi:thioredoxin-related transmembrane protein 2-B-like [Saccoglossus kowalevskii]|uniref:Thioredoxin-related transmembrane protein 2-A-like n=1 Tax=Saccoglossus kowalevskii TaxID=10224 RepID=A0ABM0GVW8_SACKO|nr:PREDICTED: thioredoxin-related transmembrane protein 2-A-like [Saccoglossus kowalevskii]
MFDKDLKTFLSPHYIFNGFLSFSYLFFKLTPPICDYVFPRDECKLSWDDSNLYLFLLCVIVIKNRKTYNWLQYISTSFIFAKIANGVLFLRADPRWAALYGIVCIVIFVIFPESAYSGPDSITYFSGDTLEEQLEKDRKKYWLVEFYAGWSPACVRFSSIFAELSVKYSNEYLKFGKFNAGSSPEIAEKFKVNASAMSRQLPTLLLFHNNKPQMRVPVWDNKGRVEKYSFSENSIVYDFDLNKLYEETTKMCKDKKSKKKADAVKDEKEKKND